MKNEHYNQGREAACHGLEISVCPYNRGSREWIDWRNGWVDACRDLVAIGLAVPAYED